MVVAGDTKRSPAPAAAMVTDQCARCVIIELTSERKRTIVFPSFPSPSLSLCLSLFRSFNRRATAESIVRKRTLADLPKRRLPELVTSKTCRGASSQIARDVIFVRGRITSEQQGLLLSHRGSRRLEKGRRRGVDKEKLSGLQKFGPVGLVARITDRARC